MTGKASETAEGGSMIDVDMESLPKYLRRSMDEYEQSKGNRNYEGLYWWQLNSDINCAEVDGDISPVVANTLRVEVLGMYS